MTSRRNGTMKRTKELNHVKQNIPNWVVIIGTALLSTLSIRLCCRLKQVFDFTRGRKTQGPLKENGTSISNKRHESSKLHSQLYCFIPDQYGCFHCHSDGVAGDDTLPLVKVASFQSNKESDSLIWASVADHLHIPPKPFNHSNSLDSLYISESGSDIYSKREIIQKLRQQLKRRDDMIVEMQVQITKLQNSLIVQKAHTTHLQAQLDSSNQELLDSEWEIQRLRKIISNQFSNELSPPKNSLDTRI